MSGMKSKTIKAVLRKKIDGWLATIEDEKLRAQVKRNAIVTGGAIASMLLGEKVSDFDVYFADHDTTLAVAKYYLARFTTKMNLTVVDEDGRVKIGIPSVGVAGGDVLDDPNEIEDVFQETEKKALDTDDEENSALPKHRPIFMTSNAITLSGKIQLILRFYGAPDKIHENYDFVHCTNYWSSKPPGELVLRPAALEALLSRELRYVGSKYPICSLVRVRKFVGRGWKINAGQILKMAFQISKLDLEDVRVLEDQLTGVDTAYFLQLVERLKESDPEKVNAAYLVEIIDRIF